MAGSGVRDFTFDDHLIDVDFPIAYGHRRVIVASMAYEGRRVVGNEP